MEEHFFFENNGERIFGVLYRPSEELQTGMVFCHPFAEERQEAHRVLVSSARRLADAGYAVLRFDYRGTGDSDGEFGDYGVNDRLSDIFKAMEVLKEKTGVRKVGLLGLRLGATLAILVAKEKSDVKFLVLWAPIVSPKAYLHQFLRANLVVQMAAYKAIKTTRDELIRQLLEGKSVNVEGYYLSGKFYKEAIQVDLLRNCTIVSVCGLVIQVSGEETAPDPLLVKLAEDGLKHPKSEYCRIDEELFWLEKKYYVPDSKSLFDKTLQWIRSMG